MILLIICIILFTYLIIELIGISYWLLRANYYENNPLLIFPNYNENILIEFKNQITRVRDYDEMFNIYFHGRKTRDITRTELHTFLKRNLYNPDTLHISDRYSVVSNPVNDNEVDNAINDIIIEIELKNNYKFSIEESSIENHYVGGREKIVSTFMPVFLLLVVKVVKMTGYIDTQMRNYYCKSGEYGLSFAYRENKQFEIDKILIFFHGIGFGYTTYLDFVDILPKYKHVILIELPNISYGRYIDDYPMPDKIIESIDNYINEIFENDQIEKGIDLYGHSYGSFIVSQIVRHKTIIKNEQYWIKNIDFIVLFDPICFFETMHNTTYILTSGRELYLSRAKNELTYTFDSYIKYVYNLILLILFYDFLFKHLELQLIFSKKTFIGKSIFPLEYMTNKTIVILSGKDVIINSKYIYDNLISSEVNVKLVKSFDHGDIMQIDETVINISKYIKNIIKS